jgi:aldehyde dehydrogenase (NAD+)
MVDDPRVPVVSATGSTAMGRIVGERVARRFGRSILELGGNNAAIVAPSADLDLPCARSRSAPWAPPASAAPRCAV